MQRPVHDFALLPLAALAAFLASAAPAARAQSASFTVAQHGQPVGTASFRFMATPQGYGSTALVRVAMQGLDYQLSKTERLSAANQLEHVQLSAIVNGSAVSVTAAPDPAQILVNISANGRASPVRLNAHPAAVFLADFDPGALETLLALGVTHNNRDLWAILPKQTGSQSAAPSQAASIQPVQLATEADERGTLDGNPIVVHHLVATIGSAVTEIFSGPDNQLLQAELPQQGFALIRKGFVLTPPAKPGAAPSPAQ